MTVDIAGHTRRCVYLPKLVSSPKMYNLHPLTNWWCKAKGGVCIEPHLPIQPHLTHPGDFGACLIATVAVMLDAASAENFHTFAWTHGDSLDKYAVSY